MRKNDASLLKDKGMRVINVKIRDYLYKEIREAALRHDKTANDLICMFLDRAILEDIEHYMYKLPRYTTLFKNSLKKAS